MKEVEKELLLQALHSDSLLMQEYIKMLSTIEQMDQIQLQPSENIVNAIKEMAKSTGLQKV
jgi:hypothetical protein